MAGRNVLLNPKTSPINLNTKRKSENTTAPSSIPQYIYQGHVVRQGMLKSHLFTADLLGSQPRTRIWYQNHLGDEEKSPPLYLHLRCSLQTLHHLPPPLYLSVQSHCGVQAVGGKERRQRKSRRRAGEHESRFQSLAFFTFLSFSLSLSATTLQTETLKSAMAEC